MNELELEQMVVDKGLTAPRITQQDVYDAFSKEIDPQYHIFPGTTTTVCLLTLNNGFSLTGVSAAASPENFDEEIGREVALEDARGKIWAFLGYGLKDALFNARRSQ